MPAMVAPGSSWENPDIPLDLGQIRNHLGLLSSDFMYLNPKKLIQIYSKITDLAVMLGIQRTQLYSDRIALKKDTLLRKRIIHLVIVSDLVFELLKKNEKKTFHWLVTPNLTLFGETPFDVIMRDEGDALISWLMERRGLNPGAAF